MKPVAQVVMTGVLVGGAGIAAWVFLPKLQAPQTVVGIAAAESSELARRLIDQYDPGADVARATVERSGFWEDLSDERIGQLIGDDARRAQDVLNKEAQRINEMLKSSISRLKQHGQKYEALSSDAPSTSFSKVSFGNNESAMSRSMSEGLRQSRGAAQSNAAILKKASNAVAKGLQAASGEASGNDSLIANRMHGVALYHEGLALDRNARIVRGEADSVLEALRQLHIKTNLLTTVSQIVQSSGIDGAISKQQKRLVEAQESNKSVQQSVTELETKIETTKSGIKERSGLAATLRNQLDTLESRGVRYESSNAGDEFASEYEALSARYRAVLRKSQALQHGTISGAHLEAGSDPLTGQYVPDRDGGEIAYEPGLDELERSLVRLGWEQAGAKQVLDDETVEMKRLEDMKNSYASKADAANASLQEGVQNGAALVGKYHELSTEIMSLENEAIGTLKKAKLAFSTAKRSAQTRITDLPELTDEKEERSPAKLIKKDKWLVAQMASQSADAATRASMVLYDRYSHLTKAVAMFESMDGAFENVDLKLDDMIALLASTKEDAESLLDDAIDTFEGAGRNFDQHWSIAASVAAADYMLALFDHPELVNVSIANYQSAVKGRETEPRLRPFVNRLEQLRNR